MIPGVNKISRKASIVSINRAGGSRGCSEWGKSPLRKILGSKEHLSWPKIELNVAEIITVQDFKHTKY